MIRLMLMISNLLSFRCVSAFVRTDQFKHGFYLGKINNLKLNAQGSLGRMRGWKYQDEI